MLGVGDYPYFFFLTRYKVQFGLAIDLYTYQKVGAKFILTNKHCIIADEAGLGKSAQALAAISKTKSKALLIVPAFLKKNWEAEVKKCAPHLTVKAYYTKAQMKPTDHDIVIISYSQLKHAFKVSYKRTFVVFDEVHYIKSPNAQRTVSAHELIESMKPEYVVGLSATPVMNRVSEFYTVAGICSYRKMPWKYDILRDFNYWQFCEEFSHKREFEINGRRIRKFEGTRNIDKLKLYLRGKYLRRKATRVLSLPPLREKEVLVNYKIKDEELTAEWENHKEGLTGHISTGKLSSALAKAEFTAEYVRGLHAEIKNPILVFTDHPGVCERIASLCPKFRTAIIDGGVASERRFEVVKAFQNGSVDILIATIGSCSTGFNITKTNQVVFNDLSWTSANNYQALRRVHRIGQTKDTLAHYILGSAVDILISKALRIKERDLKEIL